MRAKYVSVFGLSDVIQKPDWFSKQRKRIILSHDAGYPLVFPTISAATHYDVRRLVSGLPPVPAPKPTAQDVGLWYAALRCVRDPGHREPLLGDGYCCVSLPRRTSRGRASYDAFFGLGFLTLERRLSSSSPSTCRQSRSRYSRGPLEAPTIAAGRAGGLSWRGDPVGSIVSWLGVPVKEGHGVVPSSRFLGSTSHRNPSLWR